MRIAVIATSTVPSRTANALQVMQVCQALAELGHTVHLWLPRVDQDPGPEAVAAFYGLRARVPIHRLGTLRALRRYDFCLRAVLAAQRWGCDLVYAWPLQAAALAAWLGVPTVLEVHDLPTGRLGPRLFAAFLRAPARRRILVTTEALRRQLERRYGRELGPPLAQIAPNGVDLVRYADLPEPPEARRRLGLPDAFTAVYTGQFYAGRGLELMAELARRNPQVSFVWAGGDEAALARWRERLEREGLGNVRLLGYRPHAEVPLIQAAGDVLLMPYGRRIAVSGGGDTSSVASPMKAFEYLAAGRAILASDLPVFREVLDEASAVLLPPEEVEAWDAALKALREDPARRQALAETARRAAQRYSWHARQARALEGMGEGGGD